MSICGVPTLSWPYACDIDEANSLRFDAGTGRLWVKPETPSYAYEAVPTFLTIPGAAETAPSSSDDALRVWWAGAVAEYGQRVSFDLSTVASITHTNTTCYTQQIRTYAVMPEIRWQNAWHAMRVLIGMRGFYNDVQSGITVSGPHDAELGDPWDVGGPGPFGDPYPEIEAFEGITVDSPTASLHYRSAQHLIDLWNGWTAVSPGSSVTVTVRLIGRTGPIPVNEAPYYKSYADVIPGQMRLVSQVVTIG